MIPIKPKNVIWSYEQWNAIYASGEDILVNAGAGSGKTAVLTERIIQILKNGISLENLIVLTFTKAAASEMKERLREKLIKEIKNGDKKLQVELEYIDQASIQTFDSFALGLVKRYHYLLNSDRSINIGDSVVFTITKKKIIDEVFNELYEEENQAFYDLINLFSIKNDNNVQKYIYDIYNKIELIPEKEEYLKYYLDNYYNHIFIDKSITEFLDLLKIEVEKIKQRINRLKQEVTDVILINHIEDCEELLAGLFSSKSYQNYLENIEISMPTMPRKVDDEDQKIRVSYEKDRIKDHLKKLKEYLTYQNEDEMYLEIIETKKYAEIIIEIIERIDKKFIVFKKSINSYEFLDIAKLAIKLVKENDELREQIKSSTYEILIDEYQDTSDIQEILISYIANNNVYMVGDIKQSIYRFRNANPDIFKDKYQLFKEQRKGLAIDLSKNFRSREEVLKNINLIFSQIMSIELGGVNYNDQHALVYGNKDYSTNSPYDNYNVDVLTYDYDNYELTKHEIDAFIVGKDIKNKISNKYQIYDKDKKIVRDALYSDFTILTTEKKQFDLYKKIFEYLQIPLVIHKDEDFVRSSEIYVIKNILRCIYSLYNPNYYHDNFKDALLSVLRSFLVEIPDKIISKIYSIELKEGLKLHCPEIFEKLINITDKVENSSTSEILSQIYQTFNIYENIVKLGNIEQVEDKLNYLLLKFKEFDKIGYQIEDTIKYLEAVMEEDLDIEFISNRELKDNVVNMMTIHKSKGLEFPICYFPELDVNFNFTDIKEKMIFDKKYGIIIPTFKEGLKETFYKLLVKQKYKIEEISERMRVFYVALTRAKEKMIIVSPKFEESYKYDKKLVPLVDRLNYKSFFSILSSIQYSIKDYTKEILLEGMTKDYEIVTNLNKIQFSSQEKIDLHCVSLTKKEEKKFIASNRNIKLLDQETLKNMKFGTRIHKYLEALDFTSDLNHQIDEIDCEKQIKNKLKAFFNTDIFKKKIINSYHEYQFTFGIEEVINGIIDLILETDNELIIIDYKLSNLEKEEYVKQLTIYKQFLEQISSKHICAYLYSINNEELKLIL